MALIVNHQLEEVWLELLINVLLFFGTTDGLVQRQVDFIRLIVGDLLIDEDIAVRQEEHALH